MTESLTLQTGTKHQLIHPISWFIFLGYLLMALLTYLLILHFQVARQLFEDTALIVNINAVWFSLGIVIYGVFALSKNYRRAKLSNLRMVLDTQFLIVMAFLLFGLKQVLDLVLYLDSTASSEFITAVSNTGKVLEFGGFVAGLASIYFGRKRSE